MIDGCVFVGNEVDAPYGSGGAIGASRDAVVTVTRCTLVRNRLRSDFQDQGGGGIAIPGGSVSHSILAWSEGLAVSSTVRTRCSDFYGNSLGDSLRGVDEGGNFSADPEFCAVDPAASLNFTLQEDSPCAPGNHPDGASCGLIGAAPVGCGTVSVEATTWSRLKSMYRR